VYAPYEGHEQGAVEMGWEKVPENRLLEPLVTAADFKTVLRDRGSSPLLGCRVSCRDMRTERMILVLRGVAELAGCLFRRSEWGSFRGKGSI
jgi:hypothetical protein